jgi:CHAT domain-containing protein
MNILFKKLKAMLLFCLVSLFLCIPCYSQFGLGSSLKKKAEDLVREKLKERTEEKADSYDTLSFNYAIAFLDKTASFRNRQEGEGLVKTANFMMGDNGTKSPQAVKRELFDFASLNYSLGNHFLAATYLQLLTIGQYANAEDPIHLKSLGLLGIIYNDMGRFALSEKYTLLAMEGWEAYQGKESVGFLAEVSNLAVLRMNEGDYLAAELLMASLRQQLIKSKDDQELPYAIYLNNVAILNQYMGRTAAALEQMQACIKEAEQRLMNSNTTYLQFLTNKAILEQENGQLVRAEESFKKVVKLQSSIIKLGKKSEDNLAHTKANLAALYVVKEQYDLAENLLKEALAIYEKNKGVDDLQTASIQADLGNLYRFLGRYDEVEALLQEALYTRERKLAKGHPILIQNKEDLAIFYWKSGAIEKARSNYQEVMDASLAFVQTYFGALSEAEKTKYWEQMKVRFFRYYNFATENAAEQPALLVSLMKYRLASKGILLTASTALQQEIAASDNAEVQLLFQDWLDLKLQLANVYAMTSEELVTQKINVDSLEQRTNNTEKLLANKSKAFSKAFEAKNLDFVKVGASLKPGEALVEIIQFPLFNQQLTDQSVYAYIIIKAGQKLPKLIINKQGVNLEGKYFSYYNNVIKQQFEDKYSFEQFYLPIAGALVGSNKVYISPDGIYNQLNLNTLQQSNGRYLIQDYDFRYIGHPNDILKAKQLNKNITGIAFLMGNPSYGNSGIQQLPGTKVEISTISKYLKSQLKVNEYTENDATEKNLKEVHSPKIIHLASHGFFLEDEQLHDNLMGIQIEYIQQNPLLRSGLLLSGAATNGATSTSQSFNQADNGIFTAYEAINLDLRNTEMVVLSACETGKGDLKAGEGVYGLQRAFIIAGAESIIMSMWKVDDQATQQLMTLFYKNRVQAANISAAFRQAQLSLMQQYKDPYYWGAFMMFSR